jgi:magnesium-transporting ATPase (P-type)
VAGAVVSCHCDSMYRLLMKVVTYTTYRIVFFLLYNNFIPISLYVTIELVNVGQAYLISSDENLYNAELDVPCAVKSSNLVQELGLFVEADPRN